MPECPPQWLHLVDLAVPTYPRDKLTIRSNMQWTRSLEVSVCPVSRSGELGRIYQVIYYFQAQWEVGGNGKWQKRMKGQQNNELTNDQLLSIFHLLQNKKERQQQICTFKESMSGCFNHLMQSEMNYSVSCYDLIMNYAELNQCYFLSFIKYIIKNYTNWWYQSDQSDFYR